MADSSRRGPRSELDSLRALPFFVIVGALIASVGPVSAGAFADVTASSGIDFVHRTGARGDFDLREIMSGGGGFLDADGDGDLDVILVQGEGTSRLYRNDGGVFADVTEASGAGVAGYGMGCAACDWDLDGDVDLYVTRVGNDVALRNDGAGQFADVTETAGLGTRGFGSSAAFLDYDRDGLPDLYVTRYVHVAAGSQGRCNNASGRRDYCNPTAYEPTTDVLYRNLGDGRFADVSAATGVGSARGYGLALLASDFDGDGWIDVYVANDQSPAFLWRNRGNGTFEEDALLAGCAYSGEGAAIAGMGTAAGDLDDDGDLDLLVTNIREELNLFLRNDGSEFADAGWAWGDWGWMQPHTGFGLALFDQDLDGSLDLFVANGSVVMVPPGNHYRQPNQFLRRDQEGRFVDAGADAGAGILEPGVSRGVARCGEAPQLLRNDAGREGRWLGVLPVHRRGAGPVLNARVVVEAGGRSLVGEVRPQQSYLSTSDPRVHFGLGAIAPIDRVVVEWPDGRREAWPYVEGNRYVTLRAGTGQREAR